MKKNYLIPLAIAAGLGAAFLIGTKEPGLQKAEKEIPKDEPPAQSAPVQNQPRIPGVTTGAFQRDPLPIITPEAGNRQAIQELADKMGVPAVFPPETTEDSEVTKTDYGILVGKPNKDILNAMAVLKNQDPEIQAGAARALGEIADPRAEDLLRQVLQSSRSDEVRGAAALALSNAKQGESLSLLANILGDNDPWVRDNARAALAQIGAKTEKYLRAGMHSNNRNEAMECAHLLEATMGVEIPAEFWIEKSK